VPNAVVRIRLHELSVEWLEAVAELLQRIENADRALLEDAILDGAYRVRSVMFRAAAERPE
jgi:hypothetical protein